ncbi:MAG: DUF2169 domain-containing protein [Pseudomonadota bacterium]
MKISKPDHLGFLWQAFLDRGRNMAAAAVLACFTLDDPPAQKIVAEAQLWTAVEEALGPEEILDSGRPKIRGEYLVYGRAYSAKPVQGLAARVRVGNREKTLLVAGERDVIQGKTFSGDPEPFSSMDLSWNNAFGGPGFPENPLGKGYKPKEGSRAVWPNIHDPNRPALLPGEVQPPAGFAAYPPFWPQKSRFLGKFTSKWLIEDWPDFPSDGNPEFFNTAPEDQRLNFYFRGDEEIFLENMHPERKTIRSALPGIRPRLFKKTGPPDDVFAEIPLQPETLWLFPGLAKGLLLFRGATPVADELLSDVAGFYVFSEKLTEPPQPIEHYQGVAAAPPTPEEPEEAPEEELPPEPQLAAPPEMIKPADPDIESQFQELSQSIEELETRARTEMKQAGLNPDEVLKRLMPPPEAAPGSSAAGLEDAIRSLESQARAMLSQAGLDEREGLKLLEPSPALPEISTAGILGLLQAAGLLTPELKARVKEFEAAAGNLAEAEQSLENSPEDNLAAVSQDQPEMPPRVVGPISREEALARLEQGRDLSGLDLTGLDFSGQKMAGVVFADSILEGAVFSGADLTGANFTAALLTAADFSRTKLVSAVFKRCLAPEAIFIKADLTGAHLGGGDFSDADFSEALLSEAIISEGLFSRAKMVGISGLGLSALKTDFQGALLTRANLDSSNLGQADLSGCELSQAQLSGLKAEGLILNGATGEKVDFCSSNLAGSRADDKTNFLMARINRAVLRGAQWAGARLVGAHLAGCLMEGADFSGADLSRAQLPLAVLKEARLIRTRAVEADMSGVNLFYASLRRADLGGAVLRDANLFGADLFRANLAKTDLTNALLKRTLLDLKL